MPDAGSAAAIDTTTSIKSGLLIGRWPAEFQAHVSGLYVVKGLLPTGALVQMVSPPNQGKTAVALDMALHIAAARPTYRGRRIRQGLVVYFALEAPQSVENRITAWCQHHDVDRETLQLVLVSGALDLRSTQSVAEARTILFKAQMAAQMPVVLMVIDTQSRAMTGANENASEDIGLMIEHCNAIMHESPKACLMLVHHVGKDESRGARGHSSQLAAVDVCIELRDGSINVVKSRDNVKGDALSYQVIGVRIGTDEDGEEVTAAIAVESSLPAVPRGPRTALSDGSKVALRTLRDLLLASGTAIHPLECAPGTKAVKLEAWRAEHAKRYGGADTDKRTADAARKAWVRALEQLQAAGIVKVGDSWALAVDRKPHP